MCGNRRAAPCHGDQRCACIARYAHCVFVQAGRAALADAQGKIEERLARWLLAAHDRIAGDRLALTHEFLSIVPGARS